MGEGGYRMEKKLVRWRARRLCGGEGNSISPRELTIVETRR